MEYFDIELLELDDKGAEKKVKLADFKGKNVVLYFYPKDDTPICTKEAKDFRDHANMFPEDTIIIGVSADDIESHKHFFEKHKLNFHLLSDIEHNLARAFDVLVDRITKDGKQEGISRSTFVIDKKGKVVKMWRNVDIQGHIGEVLEFVKTLK